MHFSASEPLVQMMMDLISSAKDFCTVFGIYDHLGKINEDDLESLQNTTSVFLKPRIRRPSICLDRMQPEISQVMFVQQRRASQQERCLLRLLGMQTVKD